MDSYIGKKVIVRANRAGVFYGTLTAKEGTEVQMANVRKLYYWSGANAVEQLANEGVRNASDCKFTVSNKEATVSDYIQIIPCTEEAIINIENVQSWER